MKLTLLPRVIGALALIMGGAHPGGDTLWAQGQREEGRLVQTRVIANFEGPQALAGLTCSKAVRVAVTTQGVTSGAQALELTCLSAEHVADDADRRVYFDFAPLLDGSNFSRIAFDVTNPGSRPAGVYMTLYNPGANSDWGYDGDGGRIPPGATRTVTLDLRKLGRALQAMVDISRVFRIGVGVEQRPTEDATVCIDNIRLEFDPALGSPTTHLKSTALQLQQAYAGAVKRAAWDKVSADRRTVLRADADKLLGQVKDVVAACEKAEREGGFAGAYHAVNTGLYALKEANEIGRLLLLGEQAFYVWGMSPYVNIFRNEYPTPGAMNRAATPMRIEVAMARQEFRDTVFMVSGNAEGDQKIEVSLETADKALKATTLVQEALYLKNAAGQIIGGAHYRLEGPLTIPQGQSRQIRLRFDTHQGGLAPGRHDFVIRLRDAQHSCAQTIPGTVQVWDLSLPDPAAIMSNDTYAEFCNSSLADLTDLMVKDMKAYGLNAFFVHPFEISVAQPQGGVKFEFARLDEYVGLVMSNWGEGPRPQFIFSLGYGIMPGEADLGAWVDQFRAVLERHGVKPSDWYFVFGDEANEKQLLSFETPLGETMRRAAPGARISTNTSATIADPAARARHFATIDRWEPDLDVVHMNPDLLPYLRPTGKPINLFRCRGAYSVRGANMYNYYRVYGWEAAREGCAGMGVWTYCVDNKRDAWTDRENQFCLVFRHPTKRDLVHSRRYEAFREGIDDYRTVWKLREVAKARGAAAVAAAEKLIQQAVADITADVTDTGRCEKWRLRIAGRILELQGAQHVH